MIPKQVFKKLIDIELLNRYYSVPTRAYHNIFHALDVYNKVMVIDPTASKELQLAALWHDAVYIPGSAYNEQQSAMALQHEAKLLDYTGETVKKAAQLINGTSVIWHLYSGTLGGEHATLLDADISALSDDYDTFRLNQENICIENFNKLSGGKNLSLQADFLYKMMLSRPYLYHTGYGRTHYETRAIMNITKFKGTHGN